VFPTTNCITPTKIISHSLTLQERGTNKQLKQQASARQFAGKSSRPFINSIRKEYTICVCYAKYVLHSLQAYIVQQHIGTLPHASLRQFIPHAFLKQPTLVGQSTLRFACT